VLSTITVADVYGVVPFSDMRIQAVLLLPVETSCIRETCTVYKTVDVIVAVGVLVPVAAGVIVTVTVGGTVRVAVLVLVADEICVAVTVRVFVKTKVFVRVACGVRVAVASRIMSSKASGIRFTEQEYISVSTIKNKHSFFIMFRHIFLFLFKPYELIIAPSGKKYMMK
jgi:hypothetical protein